MKSQILYRQLLDKYIQFYQLSYKEWYGKNYEPFHLSTFLQNNEHLFKEDLKNLFEELYRQSLAEDFYWTLSNYKVYERTFEKRKAEYLSKYISGSETDFLNDEENVLKEYIDESRNPHWIDPHFEEYDLLHYGYLFFLEDDFIKNIAFDQRRKLEFLKIQKQKSRNPYPAIFKDKESYDLFEFLIKGLGSTNADLSYIYRRMAEYDLEDPRIISTIEDYKEFVDHKYKLAISKLKTLDEVQTQKRWARFESVLKEFFNQRV